MPNINFKRTYLLGEAYESIKERATQVLDKYLEYENLLTGEFNFKVHHVKL